ncbi:MAG: carbohydrate kinase [Nocardioidaceae bacterium]|nr:carbohydrate kinase [Nocardioidaceae bacterium]
MAEAPRALVVGEALVDLTRRGDEPEVARPGGSPLNIAVGLARLDVTAVLAAQVGEDDLGELLRDHVDDSDVDLRNLPPHRETTATALARLDDQGRATYEFDIRWDPSELPTVEGQDLLHVGSIGATLAPGADRVLALARTAADAGLAVSLDPNVRLPITPDVDDVRRRVDLLLATATICKLSDEDVADLGETPDSFAERALAEDTRLALLVVTFGGDGALLVSREGRVRVDVPPIELADTIGAGDSFMAAMLAGILHRGWQTRRTFTADELRTLGELAVSAAAITCSRHGADPPRGAELPGLRP